MLLEEITEENTGLGSVFDRKEQETYQMFIKKCNETDKAKYKIDLSKENERFGFIYFDYIASPYPEMIFAGMWIGQKLRGKKLSAMLLEVLFQYAEHKNAEFASTTRQRKPLTCTILKKFGFDAVDKSPRNLVYIIGQEESRLKITFENKIKEKEFGASRIMQFSGQYTLAEELPPEDAEKIYIYHPYFLLDAEKCRQKRETTQNRFDITFYN